MSDSEPVRIERTDEIIEALGREAFGASPSDRKAKGLCVDCGQPALERCYSEAGRRDVAITGMCELCFDALFAGGEDDDDASVDFPDGAS